MQRCMIERAEQMILLYDHTKFTRLGHHAGGAAGDQNHDYRYAAAKEVGRGNGRGSFDYGPSHEQRRGNGGMPAAHGPFWWTRRRPEGCARAPYAAHRAEKHGNVGRGF